MFFYRPLCDEYEMDAFTGPTSKSSFYDKCS